MNISWIPLGIHQARGFPSYTVIISSEGTPFKSRNTNDSSVVIGELNNNRLYTVTVQSLTGGGKGRQSDPGGTVVLLNVQSKHFKERISFITCSDLWSGRGRVLLLDYCYNISGHSTSSGVLLLCYPNCSMVS